MSDASGPAQVPAGWYPDPSGQAARRWWDGTRWTEHTDAPAAPAPAAPAAPAYPAYAAQAPLSVAPGTPVYGPFIWIVTLLPLVSFLLAPLSLIEFDRVLAASFADPYGTPFGGYAGYTPAGLLAQGIVTVLGWAIYAAGVVFAFLDHRWLTRLGYPRPFHWAWAFLGSVYPIGRSVVVRRRAGRGIAPMWVTIALLAVGVIATIVFTVVIVSIAFQTVTVYGGSYSSYS
ncbi:DUF2510 domain-containing protein [Herbiconiux moechotypicola]|uniref:DUF2510 domain-containing protein n=1 Tax=Herbiconiux moechotypicola TaxID=637393 RepID=A0ABN3E0A0_9MICO|nr:DUF2510 domain-containing protein [Herbiconiux moechotypicola]MCS5731096.1 DUF2510 domain-containing protein [Herbiconiux moechotypicola]